MENTLFSQAVSGRRRPGYLIAALYLVCLVIVTLGLSLGIGIAAVILIALLRPSLVTGPDPQALGQAIDVSLSRGITGYAIGFIPFLVFLGLTWLWVRLVDGRPFHTIGLRTKRPLFEWLRGMGLGAGLLIFSVLLALPMGWMKFEGIGDPDSAAWQVVTWPALYLFFFLIQGPAEEVISRGYLMPVLGARGGAWVGVIVSSLVFALMHALNPNVGVIPIVNLFLAGAFAALYALKEEGLWGVFGWHTAWNWVQGYLVGLPISGMEVEHPIFNLAEIGPDWYTGGAFGPEGGLGVTIVMALGIAYLLWLLHKKPGEKSGAGHVTGM